MSFAQFKQANERFDRHRGSWHGWLDNYTLLCAASTQFGRMGLSEMVPRLFRRATDEKNLYFALEQICEFGGSTPGPDGVSVETRAGVSFQMTRDVRDALRENSYVHSPTKVIFVPKASGRGRRRIHLHNLVDRLVQRGLVQAVQPLLDPQFDSRSFGYRPGLDRCHALAAAERLVADGKTAAVSEYLKDAFEHVAQGRLLDILRRYLPYRGSRPLTAQEARDIESLFDLLSKVLVTKSGTGLRQGGPLPPLMLNVYLTHLLDRPWRAATPGTSLLRRYVDDLLALGETVGQAADAREELVRLLAPTGMALKPAKAGEGAVRNLRRGDHVLWLGFDLQLGEGGLDVWLSPGAGARLDEKLRLRSTLALADRSVRNLVRAWVEQAGPAYVNEDQREWFDRITARATELGLTEVPDFRRFEHDWSRAYDRWLMIRQQDETHAAAAIAAWEVSL